MLKFFKIIWKKIIGINIIDIPSQDKLIINICLQMVSEGRISEAILQSKKCRMRKLTQKLQQFSDDVYIFRLKMKKEGFFKGSEEYKQGYDNLVLELKNKLKK